MIQWTVKWHQQTASNRNSPDSPVIQNKTEWLWHKLDRRNASTLMQHELEQINWHHHHMWWYADTLLSSRENTHINVYCGPELLSVTTPQIYLQCSPRQSVIVRGQRDDLEKRRHKYPGDTQSSSWSRESPLWSRRCWGRCSPGPSHWPALPWRYSLR